MTNNYINVSVTSRQNQKVSVSTPPASAEVTATTDTGKFWAQTAEKWATSNTIVENKDYSSKYYAEQAKISATNAGAYESAVKNTYNTFIDISDDSVIAVQNAKDEAVESVTSIATTGVASVDEKINTGIANIEAKTSVGIELVEATKTNAVTEINNTKTTAVNAVNTSKNEALNAINQTGVGNLANKDLSNLSATGEARFASGLNNKITNCLLEVPQNIKLELKDGVLTLKAGSKVIVPNGANNFDEIITTRDYSVSTTANAPCTVYYSITYNKIEAFSGESSSSDADTETTGKVHYNTTANKITRTSNSGASQQLSFPIAKIVLSGSTVTEIQEVFQGMGYIGSTVWVDKDVKGLISNGRNEDGTLRNEELINSSVKLLTQSGTHNLKVALAKTGIGAYYYEYDSVNNYIYRPDTDARYYDRFIIGDLSTVDGKITSFQPKTTFHAVDYSEAVLKSSLKEAQVVVETYVNGTSWYRVWSDGWCEQGGIVITPSSGYVDIVFVKPYKDVNYTPVVSALQAEGSWTNWYAGMSYETPAGMRVAGQSAKADLYIAWQASGYIA